MVIPVGGNSWAINKNSSDTTITGSGITNWSDRNTHVTTYFFTGRKGPIEIAVRARAVAGKSRLWFRIGDQKKILSICNSNFDTLKIGIFELKNGGYQKLIIGGISRNGATFAEISDVLIAGASVGEDTRFVKDDFYWGRRGPSVHLNYEIPPNTGQAAWFYNEITVPAGNDIPGSFFMAIGFGEGYFGIQVNSAWEKRILFSVWSPCKTNKPSEIPVNQRVTLSRKGEQIHSGEFGDEGSGGQSYRMYNWKSGTTYRFLLHGEPSTDNSTDYTAWFYAPEDGKWQLIASFRRPQTSTYLQRLHSFLENFQPETGNIPRMGLYSNQWIYTTSGVWTPIYRAKFTADATARKGARLDYSGTVKNGCFCLKNCGFFNDATEIDSWLVRSGGGQTPEIDFSALP